MRTGRPRAASDEMVFEAIGRVVTEVGPAGVTFARLGAEVGVTASALAQRFGSKRELLLAYAAQGTSIVDVTFREARADHPSAIDAIPHALARLGRSITSRTALANNLAFLQLDLIDDELRVFAVRQSRLIRRRLTALIRDAVADSDLRHDAPGELAGLLYTVYSGALLTWAIDGKGSLERWIVVRLEQALSPHRT